MDQLRVGFIGLGNMGGAIAERLLAQNTELHIHDLEQAKVAPLAAKGARPHGSAKSVADTVPIVCICLPSVAASRSVVLGDSGLHLGSNIRCLIEMSTVGPKAVTEAASKLQAKGITTVDAPVSGGADGAERGTLTILTSGSPEALHLARPVLSTISSNVVHIGAKPGEGQIMKLLNNLLAAANLATSFEVIALGEALGLSAGKMIDIFSISSGKNLMLDKKGAAIASRNFEGGAVIALLSKDISLAIAEAQGAGVAVSTLDALQGMAKVWEGAVEEGMAEQSVPSLIKHIEHKLGILR